MFSAWEACGYEVRGQHYTVLSTSANYNVTGIASWYGEPFHGRIAADGSVYDMHAMTCAHKTLPLGTIVRVTNLRTGATVRLRVTDRGPFIHGRVVDVSYAAACRLGFVQDGLATVRLTAL